MEENITKRQIKEVHNTKKDRLCGLVVTVPGYTPRGTVFDSRRYQIS
jgi:hypothetical protein